MNAKKQRIGLAAAFIILAMIPALRSSPTIDEVDLMASGVAHWQTSRFEPYAVNPPLVRMLATLPVLLLEPDTGWSPIAPSVAGRPERIIGLQFFRLNYDRIPIFFFVARMVCVCLGAIGLYVSSCWAESVFGERSGVTVAWLWCFSPMMLGHGSLMTADVGATTLGVLAFFTLRNWLRSGDLASAATMGLCVGLAMSAKATWIPILPPCFVLLWLLLRLVQRRFVSNLWVDTQHILLAVTACLLFINALYAFDQTGRPLGQIRFISSQLGPQPHQSTSDANRFTGTWLGRLPVPLPQCLLQGIDTQKVGFETAHLSRSYLMGHWQEGGWYYYYLVGIALKTPLPVLLLALMAVGVALRSRSSNLAKFHGSTGFHGSTSEQPHRLPRWMEQLLFLLPAISILVFVSLETGFNRHLRYILPAYPFAWMFMAQIAEFKGRVAKIVWGLLILQATTVLWHGPHWLSYFHEAAGGPKRGGSWLLGSNVDWGQDIYYLSQWQSRHPDAVPLKLAVHTRCDPGLLGIREFTGPTTDDLKKLQPGWYVLSVNLLNGYSTGTPNAPPYQNLKSRTPSDWAGYSICIFHIEDPPSPAAP